MPHFFVYDPNASPVANIGTLHRSVRRDLAAQWPNKIDSPDLSGVDLGQPMKWDGSAVVNLSQGELDSIAAAQAAAELADLKQSAKDIFLTPAGPDRQAIKLGFEVFRELMISELNILRAAHSLAPRTNGQFNSAFIAAYEAKIDALSG